MSKQHTEHARQGQTFVGLPADRTAPVESVTVNGETATFVSTPNGIELDVATNQDDAIVVTFTTQY
ncbi:hypothetical protein DX980_07890 [Burkholderia gladioli]|uniref:hypothetical protein n=1 Tax=Burkholderia gladioli TaxID=28095 RepID=UPI0013648B76|nr:hypothetical protein [Burkholderia gladioli]KAF1062898.1 hypothetical protein LvStA_01532 [Burkholderia gladioli]WAG19165.1 hypothetical protein DX980_07890 [Burkholderia gladioli]